MPEVFRYRGHSFFFYSNEGDPREPAHVHVRKGRSTAKFWIDPVELARGNGFSAKALRELESVVEDNRDLIERAWNEHFDG